MFVNLVIPPGIEPGSRVPQTLVLSVERRDQIDPVTVPYFILFFKGERFSLQARHNPKSSNECAVTCAKSFVCLSAWRIKSSA